MTVAGKRETPGVATTVPEGDLDWPVAGTAGVTEIRVHGVGGGSPAAMLDDAGGRQVTGDRVAGVWRGADLTIDGRPRWHREVYSWGGLTSKALSSALWLTLLPFALINLAGWMALGRRDRVPDEAGELRPSWLIALQQSTVRVVGLGATWLYVFFCAQIAMDLGAWQCTQVVCRALPAWERLGLAGHPVRAVAVAAVLPVALVAVLWRLSAVSKRRYEDYGPDRTAEPAAGSRPGLAARIALTSPRFWTPQMYDEPLRRLHLASGLLVVALLVLVVARTGGRFPDATGAALVVVVVLLVLSAVCAGWSWLCRLIFGGTGPAFAVAGLLLAGSALAAWVQPAREVAAPGIMPGTIMFLNVTLLMIYVIGLLHGTAAAAGRLQIRHASWARPATFPAPIVAMVVAMVLTLAVWSGFVAWVARWLSPAAQASTGPATTALAYPGAYKASAQLNVALAGTVLVVVALVAGWSWWWHTRRPEAGLTAELGAWQRYRDTGWRELSRADRDAGWLRTVRTWLWLAGAARWLEHLVVLGVVCSTTSLVLYAAWAFPEWWNDKRAVTAALALAVLLACAGLCALAAAGQSAHPRRLRVAVGLAFAASAAVAAWAAGQGLPTLILQTEVVRVGWLPSEGVATTVLTVIPVAGVLLLRRAIRSDSTRRMVGVAWDITTFWPRSFHPLAPPSYSQRAVPDLVHRVRGLLGDGQAVILCGHSQGAVLTVATLAQLTGLPADQRDRLSVITYGNPIGHLYMRWFPAYVNDALIRECATVGWVNFYRHTDPVGRELFAPESQLNPQSQLNRQTRLNPETPLPGRECWLPDPPTDLVRPGDGAPRVRQHGHGGYVWQSPFAHHLRSEVRRLDALTATSPPVPPRAAQG